MQREPVRVLSPFDFSVLWNVWNDATDDHCGCSCPADDMAHRQAQFIINNPIHSVAGAGIEL